MPGKLSLYLAPSCPVFVGGILLLILLGVAGGREPRRAFPATGAVLTPTPPAVPTLVARLTISGAVISAPVGLGIGADHSVWIGDAAGPDDQRLVHLAANGAVLGTYNLAPHVNQIATIKVWHDTIWVVDANEWRNNPQLFQVGNNGRILTRQGLPWQADKYRLPVVLGVDGAVLLTDLEGYGRPPFVEVLDAAGQWTGADRAGLERGGQLYHAELAAPPWQQPTRAQISLGSVTVPLMVTGGTLAYVQMFHVRADGGCYVLVGEQRANPPVLDSYVLDLAVDGTQRGRARLPDAVPLEALLGRLAVGPDEELAVLRRAGPDWAVERLVFTPQLAPLPTVLLPTLTPTPTITPTPTYAAPPVAGGRVILALPPGAESLGDPVGVAVAADGSLWIGEQANAKLGNSRLHHYAANGTPLAVPPLPEIPDDRAVGRLHRFALAGTDRWLLDEPDAWAFRLLRLDPNGTLRAHTPFPTDLIAGLIGLLAAPGGEILAVSRTGAPGTDGFSADLTQLVDATGTVAAQPVAGVPYPGGRVRLTLADHPDRGPRTGTLTIGTRHIALAAPPGARFTSAHLLAVDSAGTTTILLGVRPAGGTAPGYLAQRWSAAGRLLGQVGLPLSGLPATVIPQLAVGPDGAIDVLAPQGDWWVVVRFPLGRGPATPPTPQLAPLTTATPPPPPPADLGTLAAAADLIALVDLRYADAAAGSYPHSYGILRWFKKPPQMPTLADANRPGLLGFITYRDGPPVGIRRGVLFLQWCPNDGRRGWDPRATCGPVGDLAGVFDLDENGRLAGVGIPRYRGWTLEQFAAELRAVLSAQPPPPPLPTPAPTVTEGRP